ncbi:type IX secretion system plug protein, partial [Flavobacterium selenitireducens]
MQNGRFDNAIVNIQPQYTIGNDLIYRYDKETQFYAGNEFQYFENKDVRAAAFNVAKIDSNGSLYNAYLFTNEARAEKGYTFYPDQNGNFIPWVVNRDDPRVEADYVWVYFSLSAPSYFGKSDIFVNGMFNNYQHTPEFKMEYDEKAKLYKKAVLIKQGFTNFQYEIADKSGRIDAKNAIDGNYWQTESNYFAIVYYRENNSRYDRVVGKGAASSTDITN